MPLYLSALSPRVRRYSLSLCLRRCQPSSDSRKSTIANITRAVYERARCNGTSITQSWEDYGIETPGGKAQCQSALHFVPVSTESVTRDVVFAAFPRKVSLRPRDGGEKKNRWLREGERHPPREEDTSLARTTYSHSTRGGGPSSRRLRNFTRSRAPADIHDGRRARIATVYILFFSPRVVSAPHGPAQPHTNVTEVRDVRILARPIAARTAANLPP